MADLTITVTSDQTAYSSWLKTSIIGLSIPSSDGNPMVTQFELGDDQSDVFDKLIKEAAYELLKIYANRQMEVTGDGFSFTPGGDIEYTFFEYEPPLPNAASLRLILTDQTQKALYHYVSYLWFNLKRQEELAMSYFVDFQAQSASIHNMIYKLHD